MDTDRGRAPERGEPLSGNPERREADCPASPFEGIAWSEPSTDVRTRVIAAATARAAAVRRARRRKTWALVGVAAGTLIALGHSIWQPGSDPSSLTEPAPEVPPPLSALNRDPASTPAASPSPGSSLASRDQRAASARTDGQRDVYIALEDIRGDLEEIYEMAELIEADRIGERWLIYERLGVCVSTLEDLERRVSVRE